MDMRNLSRGKSKAMFKVPDSVRIIADGAFYKTKASQIDLTGNVISIGAGVFSASRNLQFMKIPEINANYVFDNKVLYNKDKTLLHTYLSNNSYVNYVVGEEVRKIFDRVRGRYVSGM